MTHTNTPVHLLYESDSEDLLGGALNSFGNGEECRPKDADGFIVASDSEDNDCEYEDIDSENEKQRLEETMENGTESSSATPRKRKRVA